MPSRSAVVLPLVALALVAVAALYGANKPARGGSEDTNPAAEASPKIDFAKDVQPIFAKHCYQCHGPEKEESGFRLDSRERALAGGDYGPAFVKGKSKGSALVKRISGEGDEERMPPEGEGKPLTEEQIAIVRAWVDQGAQWPDEASVGSGKRAGADHWSFQPIQRPMVPTVQNASWVRNPIDAFILSRLDRQGVAPSPEADKYTLLRRLSFDLIGLPPTPAEIEEFVRDDSPRAYERVVDRLLASPHYGERYGRYWLDLARYADTDGYEKDLPRPHAWRFRDWVINALNSDMPFDQFVVEQLAGDLLPDATPQQRSGTGFHRNTLTNREGGADPEEDRVKQTIDRTNTLGTVFLGLSVGCANCHTHKYDPITQKEFFGLYAFFNNIDEVNVGLDGGPDKPIRAGDVRNDEPEPVAPRANTRPAQPKADEAAPADAAAQDGDSAVQYKESSPKQGVNGEQDKKQKAEDRRKKRAIADAKRLYAPAVMERREPRENHLHVRGDFLTKGPIVEPHTLEVLPSFAIRGERPDRLDLARWVVNPSHPLTARVAVNRFWQWHFGRGLVNTGDDFGTQGDPPSHAELLDWLAAEFCDSGWRVKQMHKLIVMSATYKQSTQARGELYQRDPYNTWLARQNRLRAEAELVRDSALAASGLLVPNVGGKSVRPPQPPDIAALSYAGTVKWVDSVGPDRYRRGLYTWFQRTTPYPMLATFDAPDSNLACTRRERSNTPLQALTLLNDVVFVECAQALGRRLLAAPMDTLVASDGTGGGDDAIVDARVRYAFRLCLSRDPSDAEHARVKRLYQEARAEFEKDESTAKKIAGDGVAANVAPAEAAAWTLVARGMLNLDEFITRE